MQRLNVVELKNSLGDVLNKAEYQGERTIVQRRGKDPAAIISISDLRLLELLIEEAEDRLDVEAAEGPDGVGRANSLRGIPPTTRTP